MHKLKLHFPKAPRVMNLHDARGKARSIEGSSSYERPGARA